MAGLRRIPGRIAVVVAWLAAALWVSGGAFAQVPVTDYVVVQPIDVCSSTGTGCIPINNMGQTAASNPGTTQIGFIDPLTGLNSAQAAWNQVGVSVTFLPVELYKSPANKYSTNPVTEPDFRWLHVVNCSTCATGSSSNDLELLTQQPALSEGTKPAAPLSPNPTTINMFFVNTIIPATAGIVINGFSWDSYNGSAISENIFSAPTRPDTIPHELGHVLGLEHTTYGAGPLTCPEPYPDSYCPENLMTAGSAVRETPSSLIDSSTDSCGAELGQACWVPQIPPATTTQPDALDLLNPSQQAAVLLSGFMNPIPQSTTTASDPANSNTITFNIAGASNGRPNETLLAWVLAFPAGLPEVQNAFHIVSESRQNLVMDADFPHGDKDNNVGGVYYIGSWYNTCSTAQCLIVEFNRPGAGATDYLNFSTSFKSTVTTADLCGAQITFLFNDGYITTSDLGPLPCSSSTTTATASPQNPDLTAPPQIANPTTFVGNSSMSCTSCAPFASMGVSDSNPATGVESGAICYFLGSPVPCP